ncbi:hypothetical protein DDE05_00205 [Streptomyces cavourensis]|nr:hypothetical protein DDE05_00205 [Streptomyces cavourensis]
MVRILFLAASLSGLAGCTMPLAKRPAGTSWQASGPAEQGFRFDWHLSGDPAVAPMQVFDDGRETWLQFAPGQALPAIFGVGPEGERALPYVRREPYVVLAGGWRALLSAAADWRPARSAGRMPPRSRPQPPTTALAAVPAAQAGAGPLAPLHESGAVAVQPVSSTPTAPQAPPPVELFRAAPPDATLRAVLVRWADMAGWTFQPQHWAVDVDIPLAASADFPGDFKSAVRGLLGATELAEKPLQPCFYGNRVLRVVPLAQSCTRLTATPGAA